MDNFRQKTQKKLEGISAEIQKIVEEKQGMLNRIKQLDVRVTQLVGAAQALQELLNEPEDTAAPSEDQ